MSGDTTAAPVVTFIGAPGSGKTRLGKKVARLLGVPFVDSDKRIVASHGAIVDIFREHGEEYFRRLERECIVEALTEHVVLSLGGGAVINPDTRADLARRRVVRLTVSADAVAERISGPNRPLLSGGVEAWTAIVDARRAFYEEIPATVWDTSRRPLDHIAQEIADWVRQDIAACLPTPAPDHEQD